MNIVRIAIKNFRSIHSCIINPQETNVFLGPNNIGKTTILEALNFVLNPQITYKSDIIDENDFYNRVYQTISYTTRDEEELDEEHEQVENEENSNPIIYIELVLSNLSTEDEDIFRDHLVPWDNEGLEVVETTQEGEDPFANADTAIRVFFRSWYDELEDDFFFDTRFLISTTEDVDDCPFFTRTHKRHIGFLIYRESKGFTNPVTLRPNSLFGLVLQSQEISLKHFNKVLDNLEDSLSPMTNDPDVTAIINAFKSEIERYLTLSFLDDVNLSFDLTDRTRNEIKSNSQLYVLGDSALPIQKMGAGTRSLIILSMLTLIMRRRGRGILVLEEPETFLFPHAQRRVVDECVSLADQIFVSTHSPYVLERIPIEGIGRLHKSTSDDLEWMPISSESVKKINLFSRRLRKAHAEALIGNGVIIVEGDSDKWWINGASRMINKKPYRDEIQTALELQGITVVSADTSGDIIKLGNFYMEAGLKVIGVFDKIDDEGFLRKILDTEFPCFFLKQTGLEDLLVSQLEISTLKTLLTNAPHSKTDLLSEDEVNDLSVVQIRAKSKKLLISNKGSASMHEWLISILNVEEYPRTLIDIVFYSSQYVSKNQELYHFSFTR